MNRISSFAFATALLGAAVVSCGSGEGTSEGVGDDAASGGAAGATPDVDAGQDVEHDQGPADAWTQDVGHDADVLEAPVAVCNGECDKKLSSACTCAASDPCHWVANGACDQKCVGFEGGFDDTADCDLDHDGMFDFVEHELAAGFAPALILSTTETCDARSSMWATQPSLGNKYVSIFYALGYFQDCGDPETGLYQHLGDSEFIVVDAATSDGVTWTPERVFLSAHYKASITDGSAWHPPEEFQFYTGDGNAHPYVWVAVSKHGNYVSAAACDNGGLLLDYCDAGPVQLVEVKDTSNLGSLDHPLIDAAIVTESGVDYYEYYWTDLPFCGWMVASKLVADRQGCAPAANSYANQLNDWLGGWP